MLNKQTIKRPFKKKSHDRDILVVYELKYLTSKRRDRGNVPFDVFD
jgi:hypothetical protein